MDEAVACGGGVRTVANITAMAAEFCVLRFLCAVFAIFVVSLVI
jgi:hypothetical protein